MGSFILGNAPLSRNVRPHSLHRNRWLILLCPNLLHYQIRNAYTFQVQPFPFPIWPPPKSS